MCTVLFICLLGDNVVGFRAVDFGVIFIYGARFRGPYKYKGSYYSYLLNCEKGPSAQFTDSGPQGSGLSGSVRAFRVSVKICFK